MARLSGCVLAFDYGLKHIGVAVGQTVTCTASPLTTLTAREGRPRWEEVREIVAEWRPIRLLVGLPLNMDDSESEMSEAARTFAGKLSTQTGLPSSMVDERLTSFETRDAEHSHAAAAVLIAESWLNSRAD